LSNQFPFPALTQQAPERLVCPDCERELPSDGLIYVLDAKGQQRRLCRSCRKTFLAEQGQLDEEAKQAEHMRDLIRRVGKTTAPTISELATALIAKWDGVENLATFIYDFTKKMAKDAGRFTAGQLLRAVEMQVKIIAMATQHQAALTDIQALSDQELAHELNAQLAVALPTMPSEALLRAVEQLPREALQKLIDHKDQQEVEDGDVA